MLATEVQTEPVGSGRSDLTQNPYFEDLTAVGSGNGSLTTMNETFTRDVGGRVTQIARSFVTQSFSTFTPPPAQYTYAPNGRLTRFINADGTHDITYDTRGLVHTVTVQGEGVYTFEYDAVGRSSLLTYPDGHTRAQTYDPEGRIASRCYQYTTTTRCYGATYDAAGNPTTLSDPEGTDTLTYDGLDRLMQDARIASGLPDQIDNYTYNALGALKTNAGTLLDDQRPRLAGGGTADAAIPATLSGSPVTLNPAGNVTLLRGVTLAYNGRGQVQSLQRPIPGATETEQYGYDTAGRRIGRIRSSVPTGGGPTTFEAQDLYLYEGPNVAAIYSGASTSPSLAETWLFDGVDHPLRVHARSPDLVYYYELDLAGNVRRLMRPGGSDAGGYRYTAFGAQMPADATTPAAQFDQPLRWKGRLFTEFVPGAGLYDVRARAWSPEMGAFTSIDEYAFHDARSTLWGWPGENPARWSDLTGHNRPPWDPSSGFFSPEQTSVLYSASAFFVDKTTTDYNSGNYGDAAVDAVFTGATGLAGAFTQVFQRHRMTPGEFALGVTGMSCPIVAGPGVGAAEQAGAGITEGLGSQAGSRAPRPLDVIRAGLTPGLSADSEVYTVPSETELRGLYDELSTGGTPLQGSTYPGEAVTLPDGTFVGIRSTSISGGATIDVNQGGGAVWKVHVAP